jgi:hypothetical protein
VRWEEGKWIRFEIGRLREMKIMTIRWLSYHFKPTDEIPSKECWDGKKALFRDSNVLTFYRS